MLVDLNDREIEIILKALNEEKGFLYECSLIEESKNISRELDLLKDLSSKLRFIRRGL